MRLLPELTLIATLLLLAACGQRVPVQNSLPTTLPVAEFARSPSPEPTQTQAPTPSPEPSVTPIPAIPSDWKKVSIPGSSLTFGLPSDWEISESKAGKVTARKRVPTSDSASTEQLMKDIDKYGDWFVEVTIMEGVPATRLSLMKAMEGRVVQAEVIGWLSWVWAGNLISVKYRDDGTFDDMSAY